MYLLLFIPLIWEIYNDRNGDAHQTRGFFKRWNLSSKKVDVIGRIILALLLSFLNYIINRVAIGKSIFLCGAIHFLFFDYIIAYILIQKRIIKGHWYSYMGSKGIDNFHTWKQISPNIRFLIRLIIFIIANYLYIN